MDVVNMYFQAVENMKDKFEHALKFTGGQKHGGL